MTEYEQNLQALKEALERGDIQKEHFDFGKAELMKQYGIKEEGAQQASDDSNDEPPPISTAANTPKGVMYQVIINGEKKGAFEFNTVIEKIKSGEYKRDTMLWTKGMKDWVKAGELPAFENYFEEEPPPMPDTAPEVPARNKPSQKSKKPAAERIVDTEETKRKAEAKEKKAAKVMEKIKAYEEAAEHGDANTQFNLGRIFYTGDGVPKNNTKAIEWYKKAAEKGHANAQYMLGIMLINKDFKSAIEWLRKAAAQNHHMAIKELELKKEFGKI